MAISTGNAPDPTTVSDQVFVKFLNSDGTPPNAGRYADSPSLPVVNADGTQEPGSWTSEVSDPYLCHRGWHAATLSGLAEWLSARAFVAELAGVTNNDGTKVVGKQVRLLRELTDWATVGGRYRYILAILNAMRPAWVRCDLAVAPFDNYAAALGALASDPGNEDLITALQAAGDELEDTIEDFTPNSKMPIHSIVSSVSSLVELSGIYEEEGPETYDVKYAMGYLATALVHVAHQDHVNAKTGTKWTAAMSSAANQAARVTVGELFLATFDGGAALPADYTLRSLITRLQTTHATVANAAKAIACNEESIVKAQAAIEAAAASRDKALAEQKELAVAILAATDGDAGAAIVAMAGLR